LVSSYQDFHPRVLPKIAAPKIDFTDVKDHMNFARKVVDICDSSEDKTGGLTKLL
jgi:hypothetical protein